MDAVTGQSSSKSSKPLHDTDSGTSGYPSSTSDQQTLGAKALASQSSFRVKSVEILSQVSELSCTSDSDEDSEVNSKTGQDKDALFELHPLHFCSGSQREDIAEDTYRLREGLEQPDLRPLSLPSCRTAAELARAASHHCETESTPSIRFCMREGELVSARGASISIPLYHAEVGFDVETAICAVIPRSDDMETVGEAEGWIFYCDSFPLRGIVTGLVKAGAYFNELLAQYTIVRSRKASKGAFGVVVLGTRKGGGQAAAIKLLKAKVKAKTVLQEMDALNMAFGSPNIIKFFGAFMDVTVNEVTRKRWSLAFEYHPNGDLYERISGGKALTESDALPYLQDLLRALVHLGSRGVFHRDVKPENILISISRRAILTDFGVAISVTNEKALKEQVGTIGYCSPEMLLGTNVGCHGDAFSAGVVMYFMLSKSTPFLAPTPEAVRARTLAGKVSFDYGCFDHLSDDCVQLMLGLMEVNVETRLQPHEAMANKCFIQALQAAKAITEPALPELQIAQSSQLTTEAPEVSPLRVKKQNFEKARPITEGRLPLLQETSPRLEDDEDS